MHRVRSLAPWKRLCFNASVKIRRPLRDPLAGSSSWRSQLGKLGRFALVVAAGAAAAAGCSNNPVKVKIADTGSNTLNAGPATGFVEDDPAAMVDAACVTQSTAAEQR